MCEKNSSGACGQDDVPFGEEAERLSPEPREFDAAELEERLQEAERTAEALRLEGLRVKADFMNFRARVERDSTRMKVLAAEGAVTNLLPVLDNLDRAIESAAALKGDSLLEGVRMVRAQFFAVLQSMGLEEIPAAGHPFSPEIHEAVLVFPVDRSDEDGKVIEVLQKGYRLGDKLVRPSKVRVGRYEG
ncbi:MAG: nucleotide exchange factor GrpE [Synergistales bacterium]